MGVSLKELKRKEEAEQCFAQVVRLRPGCALSLGNLAGAYFYRCRHCTCILACVSLIVKHLGFPALCSQHATDCQSDNEAECIACALVEQLACIQYSDVGYGIMLHAGCAVCISFVQTSSNLRCAIWSVCPYKGLANCSIRQQSCWRCELCSASGNVPGLLIIYVCFQTSTHSSMQYRRCRRCTGPAMPADSASYFACDWLQACTMSRAS